MTATPQSTGCSFSGNNSSSAISFDQPDGACEANPALAPPAVAPLPNLPVYSFGSQFTCGGGLSGGTYQPGEYSCASGTALTVDHNIAPGIYEIDHSPAGVCDLVLGDSQTTLSKVTFYLKGGAQLCANPSAGVVITQTPYCASCASGVIASGDGIYAVLSDNTVGTTRTMGSHGGGSAWGVW